MDAAEFVRTTVMKVEPVVDQLRGRFRDQQLIVGRNLL